MRAIWLIAFVVLAAPGSIAVAKAEPVRVPIKFEDSRVYVPVSAGKAARGWFILDTGATPTIVDSRFASALHRTARNIQSVGGAGAGSSRQGEIGTVQLSVGGVPLTIRDAAAMDLGGLLGRTSGRTPAGIIGSQFFREHTVEFDFQRRELRVWPRGTDLSGRYASAIPLTFNGWTPLADAELTLPSGKRLPEHVLVDLGAKSTLLIPEPYIAKHRLGGAFGKSVTLPLGAGVGGNTFYRFARAGAISLGGNPRLTLKQPVLGLSANGTLRSEWHEGLLGADYLSRFRIAFEYSRSKLLLTRVASAPEPLDRSGLFIVWSDDPVRFTVRDVFAGGPGEAAGVRAGDELVSIAGKLAEFLSLSDIRGILKSPAANVPLVVRRGGKDVPLSLHLADLI
jgi:hypothetical protein